MDTKKLISNPDYSSRFVLLQYVYGPELDCVFSIEFKVLWSGLCSAACDEGRDVSPQEVFRDLELILGFVCPSLYHC